MNGCPYFYVILRTGIEDDKIAPIGERHAEIKFVILLIIAILYELTCLIILPFMEIGLIQNATHGDLFSIKEQHLAIYGVVYHRIEWKFTVIIALDIEYAFNPPVHDSVCPWRRRGSAVL
jgi:hypothetical protein